MTAKLQSYHTHVDLPNDLTMGSVGDIIEKIQEVGGAEIVARNDHTLPTQLLVTFEAADGWDLHEMVHELETELESYFQCGMKFPKPLPFTKEEK